MVQSSHVLTDGSDAGPACEPFDEREFELVERELVALAVRIQRHTYRMLCCIRELDERGDLLGRGFRSCAHYLNWRIGLDMGAAREKVRVARALAGLPNISAALEAGRISYAKVRAMTRVATPDTEDDLLTIAEYGTATHLESVVRRFRRVTVGDAPLERSRLSPSDSTARGTCWRTGTTTGCCPSRGG